MILAQFMNAFSVKSVQTYKTSSGPTRSILFFVVLTLFTMKLKGEEKSPYQKFGKITLSDLQRKQYPIDSEASAVVLSDIGQARLVGNNKGWFSVSFTRHRVVHILNRNGYDAANIDIKLFHNAQGEEKLSDLKAVTYNLVNGKMTETKLEKSNVYQEKKGEDWLVHTFTMPAIREGSILEYEYTTTSEFLGGLDTWYFQESNPVLWSEYQLSVPEYFSYTFITNGYLPFSIKDHRYSNETYTLKDYYNAMGTPAKTLEAKVDDYRWVIKEVPALRPEGFTTTGRNHVASLLPQLATQNLPLKPVSFRTTWEELMSDLTKSEAFGNSLSKNNAWLADDVKPLLTKAKSKQEQARLMYEFVRDQFTCTQHSGIIRNQSLRNTLKSRKGNVSDINLLLTAMLRYAGLEANPVILSTTQHGYALDLYPVLAHFNYVICKVKLDEGDVFLDATHRGLGFGHLLPLCYNGHARVVDEVATPIVLAPDSLRETSSVTLFLSADEKGHWQGSCTKTPGMFESFLHRQALREKGQDQFLQTLQQHAGKDLVVQHLDIESLQQLEEPLTLRYDLSSPMGSGEVLYVQPMFGENLKDNPFKSLRRNYPVEMPYRSDQTYTLTMDLPAGYEVDEMPEQTLIKLDEQGSGQFEYRLSKSEGTLTLRSTLRINRCFFGPAEYENLRTFYALMVSKQAEPIILKKKK